MNRRVRIPSLLLFLVLWVSALMSAEIASAAPAIALDQEAQTALNALYAQSPGAKALGDKAKAVLVFPNIHKAAFVVGAQSGDGVLFRNGKPAGRYRVDGLLAGFEAGAQSYANAMFFMSDAALRQLDRSRGWEIGTDPNIVVVDAGAAKELSTTTLQADVFSYVFGQKGLMGGIALQGLKISHAN
jgi:lipid-binding SYLF domain-containing protein